MLIDRKIMIKKLTFEEIKEVCIDLLSLDINNLQVLEPLNDKQVMQVYDYANKEIINRISEINKILMTTSNTISFDDLYTMYNVNDFEYILKIIEEFKSFIKEYQHLEVVEKETELLKIRHQEICNNYNRIKKRYVEISNRTITTFCLLLINSGHINLIGLGMYVGQKRETLVKSICNHYKLMYKIRMIKADWSENENPKYYDKIRNQIYPKIDQQTIDAIENYIISKEPHY